MKNNRQKEIFKILDELSATHEATSNTLCYNKVEDLKKLIKLEFEQNSKSVVEEYYKGKTVYYLSPITNCYTKITIDRIEINSSNGKIISIRSNNGKFYYPNEIHLEPKKND